MAVIYNQKGEVVYSEPNTKRSKGLGPYIKNVVKAILNK